MTALVWFAVGFAVGIAVIPSALFVYMLRDTIDAGFGPRDA